MVQILPLAGEVSAKPTEGEVLLSLPLPPPSSLRADTSPKGGGFVGAAPLSVRSHAPKSQRFLASFAAFPSNPNAWRMTWKM